MPPAEERIRDYVSPDGIRSKSHLALLLVSMLTSTLSEFYKLKVEWNVEQDTYAKFFHKVGVHNDAIVKRVAEQFPGMVSITNVEGMEPVDIEEVKIHHTWEEVQIHAMMHWDVDSGKSCSFPYDSVSNAKVGRPMYHIQILLGRCSNDGVCKRCSRRHTDEACSTKVLNSEYGRGRHDGDRRRTWKSECTFVEKES